VDALAAAIVEKPPDVIAAGKAFFYRQLGASVETAYALASPHIAANLVGEAAQEGLGAFVAKRKPRWED